MVILLGDAALVLKNFNDNCIDLTITSPPYDNLRTYGGHSFNFETIAKELYRVTKEGGVLVWIIGDQIINGSESGTSFRQALYIQSIGFKIHDTMIFAKNGFRMPEKTRYHQVFEYMFVFLKGSLKTFNPIKDRRVKNPGIDHTRKRYRREDGEMSRKIERVRMLQYGSRYNIWTISTGFNFLDEYALQHPATFPEQLAQDHIKSWSNEGDLILDPFAGSGTTLKAAHLLRRKWIGIEINPEYVALAKKRLTPYINQQRLEMFPVEID